MRTMLRGFLAAGALAATGCGGAQPAAPRTLWDDGAPQARVLAAIDDAWALEAAGSWQGAVDRLLGDVPTSGDAATFAWVAQLGFLAQVPGVELPWCAPPALPVDTPWANVMASEFAAASARACEREAGRLVPLADPGGRAPDWWTVLGPLAGHGELPPAEHPCLASRALPDTCALPGGVVHARREAGGAQAMTIGDGRGSWVAESFVEIDAPGSFDVLATLPVEGILRIGDTVVLERSRADTYGAQTRVARVELTGGIHRVRIELGTAGTARVGFRLVPVGDAVPRWQAVAEPTGAVLRVEVAPHVASYAAAERVAWSDDGLLALATVARLTADSELAAFVMERLEGVAPAASEGAAALAIAHLSDLRFDLPPSVRGDRALRSLRGALETDAGPASVAAHGVALELARRELDAGQLDAARAFALELASREERDAPEALWLARFRDQEGQTELYRRALREAAALAPMDCDIAADLAREDELRGIPPDPATLPAVWRACPAVVERVVRSFHIPRGELDLAAQHVESLLAAEPWTTDFARLLGDIAAARGDEAGVERALAHERAWTPTPALPSWEEIDRTAARDPSGAAAMLDARRQTLSASLGVESVASFLRAETLLAADRIDGLAVIREYVESGAQYGGDVVYVLDHMVTRYAPDGSAIEVVHQIFQPLTREAIGDWGEQGVPSDALLLTARTVKPDGRVYVPEDIAGKDSISMPNLEVGDFIELEWARATPPSDPEALEVLGGRFYFRVADAVLHLSRAVYEYPAAWRDAVFVETRAFDGDVAIEDLGDDMIRATYTARAMLPPRPEPRSPGPDEWTPSVRFTMGTSWEHVARRFGAMVASRTAADREVRAQALALAAGRGDACDRARRIFRFVNDDIVELGGFFSDPPAWALSGEGERLSLTWALLREAGLEPELLFVRPLDGDATETPVVDSNVFELTVVRVQGRDGWCWMEPEWDFQPFDFVRPEAQGQPAVVIVGAEPGRIEEIPRWPEASMQLRIALRAEVDADGNARVVGEEVLPLQSAPGVRSFANAVSDREAIVREFESALSRSFPGVTVESFEFEDLEDPDVPVRIRYTFRSERLARGDGAGGWTIEGAFYERPIAQSWASLPSRTRALLAVPGVLERVEVELVLPEGAGEVALPDDVVAAEGGNTFARRWRIDGRSVVMDRETRVPMQRVEPDRYAAWAEFARTIESTSRFRLRWAE